MSDPRYPVTSTTPGLDAADVGGLPAAPENGDFVARIAGVWGRFASSSVGRDLLAAADKAAQRALLSVYSTEQTDAAVAAAAAASVPAPASPASGDLLAYLTGAWSRLATTSYGRTLLALADAAAGRTALSVYSAAETDSAIGAAVGGLLYKGACRAVATSNVASLSGTTTIDGVALIAGNRVLLTAQSTASQNGPWVVAAGAWSRPSPTELQACAAFPVTEGTVYHDTVWYLTTNDPITPGSTSVAFSQLALNIPASQISDGTATGRSVLTGDATAGRTALGAASSATTVAGAVLSGDVSAATIRAAIQAATTTTPSLTSASGWTNSTSGSGATSTLNTGTGTIELAVSNNGGTGRIVRTISVPADWRVQLRVATFTDTTVNVQATLSPLRSGTSSAAYTVYGDGSLRALYTNAAAGSITVRAQSSAITAVRAAMTAGTLWLRVQSLGGTLSYQYAIGAVEASLVWVLFAAYAMPGTGDGEVTPDTFNLTLNRVASSGAQTATFDSVSYRDIGP